MHTIDFVRAFRRRWWIVLITTILGLGFAFATLPGGGSSGRGPGSRFSATHTLIADSALVPNGGAGRSTVNYDQYALFVRAGEVPDRVAKELGADGSQTSNQAAQTPRGSGGGDASASKVLSVAGTQMTASPDPATGSLAITVASPNAARSAKVANLYADELLRFIRNRAQRAYTDRTQKIDEERADLTSQIGELGAQVAADPTDAATQAELNDANRQLADLNEEADSLNEPGAGRSDLRTLEKATVAKATVSGAGRGVVASRSARLALGAGLGFALGLALLLLIERATVQIRFVSDAEGAAQMPVIAEVPRVRPQKATWFQVVTAAEPSSLLAEAYRSVRTSIVAIWARHPVQGSQNGSTGNGNGDGIKFRPLRILLVTSPGPSEGKSVSTVNLAAAFAETGLSVIVLDLDFRRPQLQRYFQRPTTPNLGDLEPTLTTTDLEAVLQDTDVPRVRYGASAPHKSDPGHAIAVGKAAARAATELADLVLLDSPPLLLANDASDLTTTADATVLLVRAERTHTNALDRAAQLLRRLEATVLGTVLIGAEHSSRDGYYGYYGYYGYGYGYGDEKDRIDEENRSTLSRMVPWSRKRHPVRTEPPKTTTGSRRERRRSGKSPSSTATKGASTTTTVDDSSNPDEPWV